MVGFWTLLQWLWKKVCQHNSFETDKTQEQILKNLINLLCAFLVKYHKVIILFLIVLIRIYFKIYWLIAP